MDSRPRQRRPSYFFGNQAGHPDGVQLQRGAHSVVRHNTIDPIPSGESGGTSGIIAYEGDDDVRIEDNWIDGQGSSYAVYAPRTAKSAWFLNRNRLGRGVYGYTACVRLAVTVTEFTGNVDADDRRCGRAGQRCRRGLHELMTYVLLTVAASRLGARASPASRATGPDWVLPGGGASQF